LQVIAGIYVNDLVSDEGTILWELWLRGLHSILVEWDGTDERWRAWARASSKKGGPVKVGACVTWYEAH
jgi:hypothetical protein